MRRAVIELRRFAFLLLMAVAGCQPFLSIAPTPSQGPTTSSTVILAVDSPTPTSTQPRPTSAIANPSPSPTLTALIPTVTPIILTPTVILSMSTPTISPTPESIICLVGNTDGDGVYIRRTLNMDDRIKAWPDETEMLVVGPDLRSEGRVWKTVRDPEGNIGYLPAEYVICVEPTIEIDPSPTPVSERTPPAATATSTATPTKSPTATHTLTPIQAGVACPDSVPWNEAKLHVGKRLAVVGPVVKTGYLRERAGSPTIMELGRNLRDPNRFTVEVRGQDRAKFPSPPEHAYIGKTVCVTGLISEENGIAGTVVSSPAQIVVVQPVPEQ